MPEWLYWVLASAVAIIWIVSMMIAAQRRDERVASRVTRHASHRVTRFRVP